MIVHKFNFLPTQKLNIAKFLTNDEPVLLLRITKEDLAHGQYALIVNKKIKEKIKKHIAEGFGLILKITKNNIRMNLKSGLLDPIIASNCDNLLRHPINNRRKLIIN